MIGFVKRHPLLSTHAATVLVLASEVVFFSLAPMLGRDGAGKAQPIVLVVIGIAALLWLWTVRFCYGRPGLADLAWGIIGFLPALLLGILMLPEYACNAGHGCM